jgi:glyoxylase-like metal-dependent hydrolase (beta-lactamase superfamily II)
MYRERIADDVYVFTSGLYAQVTAGAVVTSEGAVVIDTLPFPSETRQIIDFLAQRSPIGIRYLILTHYHADHTLGACLFQGVPVIAHRLCRDLLAERGVSALQAALEQNPELAEVSVRPPDIVFDGGDLSVRLGGKTIVLTHLPGHTPDGLTAYLKDEKILFASDVMTPTPMIVDGDPRGLIDSLRRVKSFGLENIVQGHGEMILRGEINESVNSNINYLHRILALVAGLRHDRQSRESLREHSIESCGKSRIPLHGLVQQFHFANLVSLYERMQTDKDLYRLGLRLLAEREVAKTEAGRARGARKTPAASREKSTARASRSKPTPRSKPVKGKTASRVRPPARPAGRRKR